MSKKPVNKPASKAAFIRSFPLPTPIPEIIAAGKKVGLELKYGNVYNEQSAMRKKSKVETPVVGVVSDSFRPDRVVMGTAFVPDLSKLDDAPTVKAARDSRSFEALVLVCEALAPLHEVDARRVIQAAEVMLGWEV